MLSTNLSFTHPRLRRCRRHRSPQGVLLAGRASRPGRSPERPAATLATAWQLELRPATSQASFKCGRPATWRHQPATSYLGSSTRNSQVQSATGRCSSSVWMSVCPSVRPAVHNIQFLPSTFFYQ